MSLDEEVPVAAGPSTLQKLVLSSYETHDAVMSLGQRVFTLEAEVRAMRGDLQVIVAMLRIVNPEALSTVAQALDRPSFVRRFGRWLAS